MIIIAEVRHQLVYRINKLFKRLDKTWVFPTSKGIKGFNYRFNRVEFDVINECVELDPALLHVGFDGLRDEYTMLNTAIPDSPHCEFIRRLGDGEDIEDCEYILRLRRGTLDERFGMPGSKRRLRQFKKKYADRLAAMQRGDTRPAIVYQVGDKYYIKDGKHRAALAYVMGKGLNCMVVAPKFLLEGTRLMQYELMLKDPSNYSIALEFMRGV